MKDDSSYWYILSLLLVVTFSVCIPLASILHIPATILILLCAFDYEHVIIYLSTLAATLLLARVLKRYKAHILMLFNMAVLLLFKVYISDKSMDISGPLMVLTQKAFYLGKNDLTLKEQIRFMFFVPSILAGPVIPPKIKQEKRNMKKALHILYQSLPFGIVFKCLSETRINDIPEIDWRLRIPCLYLYGLVRRCMYYFIWTLMHACFLMQGYDTPNIFPFSVETASSLKMITDSWNIYTNAWLKESVFIPLKGYGFFFASVATFTASALWHGINPCYFIMFLSFPIAVPLFKSMNQIMSGVVGSCAMKVVLALYLAFFGYPFLSLKYKQTVEVWSSVWHYGFVLLTFMTVVYIFNMCRSRLMKK